MIKAFVKYVGDSFAKPDGVGGKMATLIMNIINQKQYNTVLKNIRLEQNDVILDIGFGNGYLIKKIFKQNISVKVYGIDISADMFQKVSSKNKQKIEDGRLKLFLENISRTSFENELFDKIFTVNTVYFWNDLKGCFSEVKRILKPNGIFLNVIYTKDFLDKLPYTKYVYNKYSVTELEKITKENGMELIETVEIIKNKSYCIIAKSR